MTYNYKKFSAKEYDFSESRGLQIGDAVPNFKLSSLTGEEVYLFDDVNSVTVIELGSITCPLYSGNIEGMNILKEKYPDINFKVLYIREAHPGKKISRHTSLEEKVKDAGDIQKYFAEKREIVVDDIEGTVHKSLGLLPNTILIVGKDKKILYRADWNNSPTISKVLNNIKEGKPIKNIISKFRPAPITVTVPVLLRAGRDALFDFLLHLPGVILERSKSFFSHKEKQF